LDAGENFRYTRSGTAIQAQGPDFEEILDRELFAAAAAAAAAAEDSDFGLSFRSSSSVSGQQQRLYGYRQSRQTMHRAF
jgi:hypothetical protein